MKERIADINPECEVIGLEMFYTDETYEEFFKHGLDFVVDASDTITFKIHLIKQCLRRKIKIISSMGAQIKWTQLVSVLRISLKHIQIQLRKSFVRSFVKRVLKRCKVVFSDENPIVIREEVRKEIVPDENAKIRKAKLPPSSNAFVPSVAGLIMASHVVRERIKT